MVKRLPRSWVDIRRDWEGTLWLRAVRGVHCVHAHPPGGHSHTGFELTRDPKRSASTFYSRLSDLP